MTLKLGDEAIPGPMARVYRGALRKSCLTCRVIVDDSEQVTGTPKGGSSTRDNRSSHSSTWFVAANPVRCGSVPKEALLQAIRSR